MEREYETAHDIQNQPYDPDAFNQRSDRKATNQRTNWRKAMADARIPETWDRVQVSSRRPFNPKPPVQQNWDVGIGFVVGIAIVIAVLWVLP